MYNYNGRKYYVKYLEKYEMDVEDMYFGDMYFGDMWGFLIC